MKYKSRYKQFQLVIRKDWKEEINGIRNTKPPIIADFHNFIFDTSKCDALNHIKEEELIKAMNEAIDVKKILDFWRLEDDAKIKKPKTMEDPDDAQEEVTTKGVFSGKAK